MTVLIDTSVLAAAAFAKDPNHAHAVAVLHDVAREVCIVVAPVLSELFYFVTMRVHYRRAIEVFTRTCAAFTIEPLTTIDMMRMQAIMAQYRDVEFDYTDAAIMAVAERMQITQICTLDRRDFSIYRPAHCSHYELLP
jgi:predicted nucleic acid-binding protein